MLSRQAVFEVIAGHPVKCAETTMVWLRCTATVPTKDVPYVVRQGFFDRHHDTTRLYGIELNTRFYYNSDTESSNTFADSKVGEYYVATKKRQCLKATSAELFRVAITVYVCVRTRSIHVQTDGAVFVYPCTDIQEELSRTEWDPVTLAQMQRDAARLDKLMTVSTARQLKDEFVNFHSLFAFFVTVKTK